MATTSELIQGLREGLGHPELHKPVTASDLRAFGLPVPNHIVPSPLPWRHRAHFMLAMCFDEDVARHSYLRLLLDTVRPPSTASH